jgi:hypothetical protein
MGPNLFIHNKAQDLKGGGAVGRSPELKVSLTGWVVFPRFPLRSCLEEGSLGAVASLSCIEADSRRAAFKVGATLADPTRGPR